MRICNSYSEVSHDSVYFFFVCVHFLFIELRHRRNMMPTFIMSIVAKLSMEPHNILLLILFRRNTMVKYNGMDHSSCYKILYLLVKLIHFFLCNY